MHRRIKIGVWAHDSREVMDSFEAGKEKIGEALGYEMELTRGKNLSLYAFEDIDVNDKGVLMLVEGFVRAKGDIAKSTSSTNDRLRRIRNFCPQFANCGSRHL